MRTLIVGDLHIPFQKSGYLRFCKKINKKYKCNNVVFAGDILDNHYSSFHQTDPDGYGGSEELRLAKKMIQKWYEAFPHASICAGNHDSIPNRQAFKAGLSNHWMRPIKEVLDVPNWTFADEWIFDDVKYVHGLGRNAKSRCQQDLISVCQGHYHSESYIHFFQGETKRLFALQIGSGIDGKSYAFEYAKHYKPMHLNCGVVVDGVLPIIEYM